MVIEFSIGKIIATPHEVVIKIQGTQMITLQAQTDAIQLIGRGANVVTANCSEAKWSIKLDNEQQLLDLAAQIGIAIE
ncbi:DUF3389 domain-containing protein [Vibrio panuliri]|uniref:PTS sugar transporter subunit IIA n=1 Tax=Vibrio panuliri TaxID=1381081 RepID=A0A1Q9H9W9_9VIBR|nr:DUF3389 domain-containing protein [Vibrio panuliri]KAB1457382.1 DUF3389 domain-containing protein [Vibrio panuliri]OLQ85848.1 PTS sugar transporter subunit IIA [Vibrio panuliri]OLQ91457.1 PTS sugar transporter subunit IIA [Vibrio panuliri]